MRLHVVSDLHLGVAGFELPRTDADVVVLAGDVGRPQEALAWAARLGRPVVYVAGNHEFYGASLEGTWRTLRQLAAIAGCDVHLLEGDDWVWRGTRFLGTTMWSDFSIAGDGPARELAQARARPLVNDFARIRVDTATDRLFSPADSVALCERAAAWLDRKLDEPFDGPTVVITHHAPSARSIHPRFAGSPMNPSFASDLEHLMGTGRVALWIHGHTHDSFDYDVAGTRVLCNPRGYVRNGVAENAAFRPDLVVVV